MFANPFKDLRAHNSRCFYQGLNSYQGAKGFTFLSPHTFQFRDAVPIKGQEDLFSSSHVPSNSKVSRIRGYDPLDMVSSIPIEEHPKSKFFKQRCDQITFQCC